MEIYPLPLGCPFAPDDRDLLHFLLLKKASVQGNQNHVPAYLPISHRELYDQETPSQIFSGHLAPELYFFTTVKDKFDNSNSGKKDREVGPNGFWKSQRPKKILDDDGCLLGCMTSLNFFDNRNSKKSDWIMHEYTLADHHRFNWAICRIKRAPHTLKSKSHSDSHPTASSLPSTAGVKRKAPDHTAPSSSTLFEDFCFMDDDNFFDMDELLGTLDGPLEPECDTPTTPPPEPLGDTPTTPLEPAESFLNNTSLPPLLDTEFTDMDLGEDSLPAVEGCAHGDDTSLPPLLDTEEYSTSALPAVEGCAHGDDALITTSGQSSVAPEPINSTTIGHHPVVGVETAATAPRMVASSSRANKRRPSLDDPEFSSLFIRKRKSCSVKHIGVLRQLSKSMFSYFIT